VRSAPALALLSALLLPAAAGAAPAEAPHRVLTRVLGYAIEAKEVPEPEAACRPEDCPARSEDEVSRLMLMGDLVGAQENIWRREVEEAFARGDRAALSSIASGAGELIDALAGLEAESRSGMTPPAGSLRLYDREEVRVLAHGMFDCLLGNLRAIRARARAGAAALEASALSGGPQSTR